MLDFPNKLPTQDLNVAGFETPDVRRTPFGFDSGAQGREMRTRAASWALASASLKVATALHPLLTRSGSHRLARTWARSVTRTLDIDLAITDIEDIDTSRQYLVMPLHEGFMDIPTLLHLPLDLRFTVREELLSMPSVGPYIAETEQILVPDIPSVRGYRDLYADIAVAVDKGDSIVVFPQGSVLGVEIAFKPGVARIAERFDLPVLPVVISGTHRVWEYPFTQTVRFRQRVAMTVLPPIEREDVAIGRIRQAEIEMKSLALLEPGAPARRFVPERDGWWDDYDFDVDARFADLESRFARHRLART
jgi:1-acyl-sn-glycerol-3-phosphate acyltransferase